MTTSYSTCLYCVTAIALVKHTPFCCLRYSFRSLKKIEYNYEEPKAVVNTYPDYCYACIIEVCAKKDKFKLPMKACLSQSLMNCHVYPRHTVNKPNNFFLVNLKSYLY